VSHNKTSRCQALNYGRDALRRTFPFILLLGFLGFAGERPAGQTGASGVLLPDGREFVSWERPLAFARTYYVDNRNPEAADSNPGTLERPFLTINKAAQVLQPGERVVIKTGVYRERIDPARGGPGPTKSSVMRRTPARRLWSKAHAWSRPGGSPPLDSNWSCPRRPGARPKYFNADWTT